MAPPGRAEPGLEEEARDADDAEEAVSEEKPEEKERPSSSDVMPVLATQRQLTVMPSRGSPTAANTDRRENLWKVPCAEFRSVFVLLLFCGRVGGDGATKAEKRGSKRRGGKERQ